MTDPVMNQQKFHAPISSQSLPCRAGEELLINLNFEQFLQKTGLNSFIDFWNLSGVTVKDIGERSVIKVELKDNSTQAGKPALFYLKKHRESLSILQKLCYFLPSFRGGEGGKEFNFYCDFRAKNLATAVPIAAGSRFISFLKLESFLLTQDFAPFVDLEELILEQPQSLAGEKNRKKRQNILAAVAAYAREMHEAGLNQQDFNATHVLLNDFENGPPQVAIFDLQRVDKNPLKRLRWPIKALAELNFTLPDTIFSEEERAELFAKYKNKSKLSFLDNLQYRWISGKTRRIARHSKKRNLAPKMVD